MNSDSDDGSVRDLTADKTAAAEAPKGQDGVDSVETLRYQGSDPDGTLKMLLTERYTIVFSLFFVYSRDRCERMDSNE